MSNKLLFNQAKVLNMSKEIIIHEKQSSIFDIVEDTTTQMHTIIKEQSINLKLSSLLALKNNKKLQHNLFMALESDSLEDLEFFFKTLSRI
jgi:hypothetical protein